MIYACENRPGSYRCNLCPTGFVTDLSKVVDRELPDGPTVAARAAFNEVLDHEAAFWSMTLPG